MKNVKEITVEEQEELKEDGENLKEFSNLDKNSKMEMLAFIKGYTFAKTLENLQLNS